MRIVCISDTHKVHKGLTLPEGDVLVHAGDLTMNGRVSEIENVASWLRSLPYKHKVVIAGNHDFLFQTDPSRARALMHGLTYLQDSSCVIEGVTFWGSPWQPWFYDWAFNLRTPAELAAKWNLIPPNTDVLITHGPPHGVLDATTDGRLVGCMELRKATIVRQPKVHVFGHIHEAYGQKTIGATTYVNAALLDAAYKVAHAIQVVEVKP